MNADQDKIEALALALAAIHDEVATDTHRNAALQALLYRNAVKKGKHPIKITALSGAELKYGRPATEKDAETTARWLYDGGFDVTIQKGDFYISRTRQSENKEQA